MSIALQEARMHRALAEASRVRILELLREHGMDVRELATAVGLHTNTIRSHLDVLSEAGLLRTRQAPQEGPGRPRVIYELALERELIEERGGYKLLARILASYLSASAPDPGAAAEEAGRAWGSYLSGPPQPFAPLSSEAAIRRVVALFTELGFQPEAAGEGDQRRILLRRCPFREAAIANPEVVCALHLGLLRGALSELGAPVEATRLDPLVEPSLCIAHLRTPESSEAPRPTGS
jgi:predicted ArsR family transcriptional regulator